jgi:hypothetical protein
MSAVDLKLDNAYVEDVKRFKIVKGEKGSLILRKTEDGDYSGPVDYAATGDPVLDLDQADNTSVVNFTASKVGVSRFFFIQKSETNFDIIRQVRIEVVDSVDIAVDLGLKGEVIPDLI